MDSQITRISLPDGNTAISINGKIKGITAKSDNKFVAAKHTTDTPIMSMVFDSINEAEQWVISKQRIKTTLY